MKKFLAILLAILSFWLWNTETFQRTFFPTDYWQKEIVRLEKSIETEELLIQNQSIDLMQFSKNMPNEYIKAYNHLRADGVTEEKATEMASLFVEQELKVHEMTLEMLQDFLGRRKAELKHAEATYNRYR